MLTKFCPLWATYLPLLHIVDISITTYPPRLFNVVCKRPPNGLNITLQIRHTLVNLVNTTLFEKYVDFNVDP